METRDLTTTKKNNFINTSSTNEQVSQFLRKVFQQNNEQEINLLHKIEKVINTHPALVIMMQTQAQSLLYPQNERANILMGVALETIGHLTLQSQAEKNLITEGNQLISDFLRQDSARAILAELKKLYNRTSEMRIKTKYSESMTTLVKCFSYDPSQYTTMLVNKRVEDIINSHVFASIEAKAKHESPPQINFIDEIIRICILTQNTGIFGFGGGYLIKNSFDTLKGEKQNNGEEKEKLLIVGDGLNNLNEHLHENFRELKALLENGYESTKDVAEALYNFEELAKSGQLDAGDVAEFVADIKKSFDETMSSQERVIEQVGKTITKSSQARHSIESYLKDSPNEIRKTPNEIRKNSAMEFFGNDENGNSNRKTITDGTNPAQAPLDFQTV